MFRLQVVEILNELIDKPGYALREEVMYLPGGQQSFALSRDYMKKERYHIN